MNNEFKRRAIQSSAVALTLLTMTGGVAFTNAQTACAGEDTSTSRTAGIIWSLNTMQTNAMSASVEVEESQVTVVAATEENSEWANRLMANVDEFLYVRDSASEDGGIVGKLFKGDVADIVAAAGEWTQVRSGNVNGYVKNEFCVTGDDAYNLANSVCTTYATSQTSGLRVRSEASQEASVIDTAAEGDKLKVVTDAPTIDGWVAVDCDGTTGYVSSDYVVVALNIGTGLTIEEEEAKIAAEKAAEEAAKAAQAKKAVTTQNAAVSASYDDVTLLAALIQCEAGSEGYEGQLAVGAVVMNRVRSGGYPSSISGVIFQSGQFSPAGSGKVASVAASGPSGSCIQAAQAAIGGTDNTGGALCFKRAGSQSGVVIGNHVFF